MPAKHIEVCVYNMAKSEICSHNHFLEIRTFRSKGYVCHLIVFVCFRFYVQHAEKPVWLAVCTSPVRTSHVTSRIPRRLNVSQHGSIFTEWPCRSLWTSRTPIWTPRLGIFLYIFSAIRANAIPILRRAILLLSQVQ